MGLCHSRCHYRAGRPSRSRSGTISLSHLSRHEATNRNSHVAFNWPNHRPADTIGLGDNCRIFDADLLAVYDNPIVTTEFVLCAPIRVVHRRTISVGAARPPTTTQAIKPLV